MRETRPYGSMRGASSNGRPYRNRLNRKEYIRNYILDNCGLKS